jgi:hypothetical protein
VFSTLFPYFTTKLPTRFPPCYPRVNPRVRGEENVPAEDTQHQVQHEEGSDHNERDEVDPVEEAAQSVVGLTNRKKHRLYVYSVDFPFKHRGKVKKISVIVTRTKGGTSGKNLVKDERLI